jgi:hypothetical protein
MVVACKSAKRWFDLDAVRHENPDVGRVYNQGSYKEALVPHRRGKQIHQNPAGAPPLDTWIIPTAPYKGSHFATFPKALCEIPIKSMCPLEVCVSCGTPRRRITSDPTYVQSRNGGTPATLHMRDGTRAAEGVNNWSADKATSGDGGVTRTVDTLGWTVCDCTEPTYRPGIVLDPFGGSGTTAAVATGHGRHCLLIDIDERNLNLAHERVGMFLTDGPELPDWMTT